MDRNIVSCGEITSQVSKDGGIGPVSSDLGGESRRTKMAENSNLKESVMGIAMSTTVATVEKFTFLGTSEDGAFYIFYAQANEENGFPRLFFFFSLRQSHEHQIIVSVLFWVIQSSGRLESGTPRKVSIIVSSYGFP